MKTIENKTWTFFVNKSTIMGQAPKTRGSGRKGQLNGSSSYNKRVKKGSTNAQSKLLQNDLKAAILKIKDKTNCNENHVKNSTKAQ